MQTDLARPQQPTAIRRSDAAPNPFARFLPLDRHTGQRVELPTAPNFIATISAGWKDERGIPNVSRDGRIHLVDPDSRAPYLRECLEATEYKSLTVAFTSNDPTQIVQERLVEYSRTALKTYGDEHGLTELDGKGGRVVHAPGSRSYATALARCMVTRSVYFVLAGWDQDRKARLIFDGRDGMVHYRLRFGSANSLQAIMGQLAEIASLTNGEIVGLPLELSLTYRDCADPTGARRNVPVWSLVFKPPGGMALDGREFSALASQAIQAGRAMRLSLAPPEAETLTLAAGEYRYLADEVEVATPEPERLAIMQRGAPVDKGRARARWFAIAKGTRFESDDGREDFLSVWSNGNTSSLSYHLDTATQQETDAMLDTLQRCVAEDRMPAAWEGLDLGQPDEVIDHETGEITEAGPDPEPDPVPAAAMTPERRRELLLERYATLWDEANMLDVDMPDIGTHADWTAQQLAEACKELKALIASAMVED